MKKTHFPNPRSLFTAAERMLQQQERSNHRPNLRRIVLEQIAQENRHTYVPFGDCVSKIIISDRRFKVSKRVKEVFGV